MCPDNGLDIAQREGSGSPWIYYRWSSICSILFVVCHDQVRRQVSQCSCCRASCTYELIPPDSAIYPLVTSPSGVRCKRTSVSRLGVELHRLYRCSLVRRTPYACSPAVDDSVLIVDVREYIVAFNSVSAPVGGGRFFSTLNLPRVCAGSEGFPSCLRRV